MPCQSEHELKIGPVIKFENLLAFILFVTAFFSVDIFWSVNDGKEEKKYDERCYKVSIAFVWIIVENIICQHDAVDLCVTGQNTETKTVFVCVWIDVCVRERERKKESDERVRDVENEKEFRM